ncbi:MAG: hypothetical protein U0R64_02825 [Candidatus Nanopelagicales bacterium]
MNRVATTVGAVVGGAALLGVGVVVGSQVGQQNEATVVAAAPAEVVGLKNPKESALLDTFVRASSEFEQLIQVANKKPADKIGPALTQQAVIVRAVKREAQTPELRDAADATSQAMLLISAGVTASEGGITQEGMDAYKAATDKVKALTARYQQENGVASPSPSPSPS